MTAIRVGIGGWTFPAWRGRFYPPGLPQARELEFAARQLTAIEINGTFYRHQSPASYAAWRDAAPEGFVFTAKAHRATTHSKDLAASGPAIERFLGSGIAELGNKLGPILWQLPPFRKFDPDTMAAFLESLPSAVSGLTLRHAIEARHQSFLNPAWPALAARHGAAIVIVDSDKQALRGDVTADFVYARLQRNTADAPDGYPAPAMADWQRRLLAWSTGRSVEDLQCVAPVPIAAAAPRACFTFFIGGEKAYAPRAAVVLRQRLANELGQGL